LIAPLPVIKTKGGAQRIIFESPSALTLTWYGIMAALPPLEAHAELEQAGEQITFSKIRTLEHIGILISTTF
jgi:hypothetical protein